MCVCGVCVCVFVCARQIYHRNADLGYLRSDRYIIESTCRRDKLSKQNSAMSHSRDKGLNAKRAHQENSQSKASDSPTHVEL